MTLEIGIVFAIIGVVIFLFAFEVFPVDKIAFLIIGALLASGIISPSEAVSGFSNSATITVLSLMIISVGLETNGAINLLADKIQRLQWLPMLAMVPAFMLISGGISGFINTTAVVIIFIKIISVLYAKFKISRTKLLMPISFAGIIGGSCTLMGTSTNLIVNSVAQERGIPALGFFEFSWYGAVFLAVALVVVTLLSRFLPDDRQSDLHKDYGISDYLTAIEIGGSEQLMGKRLEETVFFTNSGIKIVRLTRNGIHKNDPNKHTLLQEKDQMVLQGDYKNILTLKNEGGFHIVGENSTDSDANKSANSEPVQVVEVLLLPNSDILGSTVPQIRPHQLGGASVIAVKKRKSLSRRGKNNLRKGTDIKGELESGDRLLLEFTSDNLNALNTIDNVVLLQECELPKTFDTSKRNYSIGILLVVILLAATGFFSILKSALLGCVLMLVFKCINLSKVYSQINWQIIFLLAGMIPLGVAMGNSGADIWISDRLLELLQGQHPSFIIGLLFFITMVLSGFVSNNATAIVITPIAITIASQLELPVKPFILAVMFAANFSFFTPVGYQTNTLIYGMGIYKFKHFFIVGGVLSLVLWGVATALLSLSL